MSQLFTLVCSIISIADIKQIKLKETDAFTSINTQTLSSFNATNKKARLHHVRTVFRKQSCMQTNHFVTQRQRNFTQHADVTNRATDPHIVNKIINKQP